MPDTLDAIALVIPAAGLLATTLARHVWLLWRLRRATRRDLEKARRDLSRFNGLTLSL